MAALTATNLTVTVNSQKIRGGERRTYCTITFDSGAGTYPSSGGVPLPSYSYFGMVRNLDHLIITGQGANATVEWVHMPTLGAIKGYHTATTFPASPGSARELPTTWTPSTPGPSPVLYVEAVGW